MAIAAIIEQHYTARYRQGSCEDHEHTGTDCSAIIGTICWIYAFHCFPDTLAQIKRPENETVILTLRIHTGHGASESKRTRKVTAIPCKIH